MKEIAVMFPPLPTAEQKQFVQAEINLELLYAVKGELKRLNKGRAPGKKSKLTIRNVMEWGFGAFLLASNKKEAEKMGIHSVKDLA